VSTAKPRGVDFMLAPSEPNRECPAASTATRFFESPSVDEVCADEKSAFSVREKG